MGKIQQLLISERESIERLALISGYNKDIVRDILKAQFEFVCDELKNGIPMHFGKLGVFEVIKKKCRGGFNFHTREMGQPKTFNKIKFKPSRKLRELIETEVNDDYNQQD